MVGSPFPHPSLVLEVVQLRVEEVVRHLVVVQDQLALRSVHLSIQVVAGTCFVVMAMGKNIVWFPPETHKNRNRRRKRGGSCSSDRKVSHVY